MRQSRAGIEPSALWIKLIKEKEVSDTDGLPKRSFGTIT